VRAAPAVPAVGQLVANLRAMTYTQTTLPKPTPPASLSRRGDYSCAAGWLLATARSASCLVQGTVIPHCAHTPKYLRLTGNNGMKKSVNMRRTHVRRCAAV